jgi:hypothetical protein
MLFSIKIYYYKAVELSEYHGKTKAKGQQVEYDRYMQKYRGSNKIYAS